jgi:Flp pilus assembly protein TadD
VGEAIAHYEQAVRIKPQFAAAHHALAPALDRQGRMGQAGKDPQRTQRLRP